LVSEVDDGKRCPKLLTRTYSISDSCGNTSTCFQYVTVSDLTEPVLDCPASASVNCYSDVPPPFASLAAFVASGGSVSDNCGYIEDSFKLFSEKISTGKPKILTRIYQIADSCNNIGSCAQRFTVLDSIAPVAICNEVEISLDSIGNMTLRRIDLQTIGSGSFDNCTAFPNLAFDIVPNRINCSNIGTPVTVVLTVTDEVGNQSTCSTNILVKDTTAPKANCRDLTVYLDDRGNIGISKEMINNNSFDNCGIRSMFIDRNKFDCNTVGVNNVLLSVVDNYANISTCTSKVTVLDTIPPEVECRDIVLNLRGDETVMITPSDLNAGSTDACGIDSMWVSKNRFTCANVGNNAVILYARDENGNISSCTANVRINGNKAPVAVDDRRFTVVNTPATVNILANDYDPNGKIDTTSLAYLNKFQHGKMVIGEKAGEIYYIPETDFIGYDTLFYVICDDGIPCGSLCDTAKLVFIITPPNVAPIAVDDSFKIGCRNITESFILNDYDPDGNEIIASIMPVVKPLHGTVNINTDGTFTYSHDFGFIGIDSFRYEICDNGMHQLCDTATVKISILIDTDCDGIPNIDDIDDDDDGILDVIEGDGSIDTDSDGVPDSLDIDSDNDGIVDNIEGQGEKPGNYIFPKGADCNGNGWDDAYDPGCSGTPFTPVDTDHDGIPDYRDKDSDNDHVPDYTEGWDTNADGYPDVLPLRQDRDRDGLDDAYDTFDRILNHYLLDAHNAISSAAPLPDFDHDGIRDWRDTDDDGDGIPTVDEDTNRDGNYANDDVDLDGHPEYLDTTNECELFVPEAFSPNGDGVHDYFQIYCIEVYPDAILYIFDRDGHLLYQHDHYGNMKYWGTEKQALWDGTSESRWVKKKGLLPPGNYLYVLVLGNGREEKGSVMISY
jgi:gliding motility-associated-like protein